MSQYAQLAVGQTGANRKRPLTAVEVKKVTSNLQVTDQFRDLSIFAVAIDTMLRSVDLLLLRVCDVLDCNGQVLERIQVGQRKTQQPVTVSLTPYTRQVVLGWIRYSAKKADDWLFTDLRGRHAHRALTTSHYRSLVKRWVRSIGLDPRYYSTHSLRRTKPTLVYQKYRDIEICRLLLGHASVASTSHYLGIEMSDALDAAETIQIFPESFHSTEDLS